MILNYNKHTLFEFFDSTCLPLLKMTRHNNVKIYNAFFQKKLCFICRHSSQRKMILLSRYYSARGGTAMTYAKKCTFFSQGILDKIKRLHKIHTLHAFIFYTFRHHVETYDLIPMISVP